MSVIKGKIRIEKLISIFLGSFFVFILLSVSIYCVITGKDVPFQIMFIFRSILALSAGLIGVLIAGKITSKFMKKNSFLIKTSGAVTLTILVYLVNPPILAEDVGELILEKNSAISPKLDSDLIIAETEKSISKSNLKTTNPNYKTPDTTITTQPIPKIECVQVSGRGCLNCGSYNQGYEMDYEIEFDTPIETYSSDFYPFRIERREGSDFSYPPFVPKEFMLTEEQESWTSLQNALNNGDFMEWPKSPIYVYMDNDNEDGFWGFCIELYLLNVTDDSEPFNFSNFFIANINAKEPESLESFSAYMSAGSKEFIEPTEEFIEPTKPTEEFIEPSETIILNRNYLNYQQKVHIKDADFITSSSNELIGIRIPFKLEDIGVYEISIEFPFTYVGVSGTLKFKLPKFISTQEVQTQNIFYQGPEDLNNYDMLIWDGIKHDYISYE
jgi:hypothetical protein